MNHDVTSLVFRVHPRKQLLRSGLLSVLVVTLPLFGALYALGLRSGTWPVVLTINLLVVAAVFAGVFRFRNTYVAVFADHLVSRTMLRRARSIPKKIVRSATLIEAYRMNATDTTAILMLRDADGSVLLSLSSLYWADRDMRAIADSIDCPFNHFPEPITHKQFIRQYSGGVGLVGRRPLFAAAALTAASVGALGVVLGLMALSGIPIA